MATELNLQEKIIVLRSRLAREGLHLEDFLKTTRQTISNYCSGKIGSIHKKKELIEIAARHGIHIDHLDFVSAPSLGGTDDSGDDLGAAERVAKRRGRPKGALNKAKRGPDGRLIEQEQIGETNVSPIEMMLW